MRVLLNLLVATGRKTGIGHYATELVESLRTTSGEDTFDTFPGPWLGWCWQTGNRLRSIIGPKKSTASQKDKEDVTPKKPGLMTTIRGFGQALMNNRFQRQCRGHSYDLYHEPNYIPFPSDLPTIATLPDLSILLHPQWHPADRVRFFEKEIPKTLERCDHFLAISEFCRQEILDTFSIKPESISCTYMGVRRGLRPISAEELPAALESAGLPPRYFLYLGTIEPRKNLLTAMRAYCALPSQLRDRWPFILVGNWGWNTEEIHEFFHEQARHRGVIHFGYLPEDQLSLVYNGARALIYPSHYEGFGLPPIEMMACGGAVLASTAGAHQEIVGEKAFLIDPEDEAGWRDAMCRVVEDEDWWQSLRQGVTEHVRPFTWEKCAEATLQVYHRVLGHISSTKQAA